ncbi:MAG: hypothetical protein GTO14_14885 [Anaerolineales bacterium]|nr:hypothetical protein [Anaerolineales bacterium]
MFSTGCYRSGVELVGTWERRIDSYEVRVIFDNDGTFQLQVGDRARTIDGVYEVEDDIIVISDEDCEEFEGKYRVERDAYTLTFFALNDACEGRTQVLTGNWGFKE